MGAIAFFGDKYGASVRVVQAGPTSLEFCGGTHVDSLGQIGPITLLSEGSIGSNTRRIFALTGHASPSNGPSSASSSCGRRPKRCAPSPTSWWPPSGASRERQRESGEGARRAAPAVERGRGRGRWPPRPPTSGVVVARRDKVEGKELQSLAEAVLRHDGVRAVVLGGLGRRGQGVDRRGDRRHARRVELVKALGPHRGRRGRRPAGLPSALAGGKDPSQLDDALAEARRLLSESE